MKKEVVNKKLFKDNLKDFNINDFFKNNNIKIWRKILIIKYIILSLVFVGYEIYFLYKFSISGCKFGIIFNIIVYFNSAIFMMLKIIFINFFILEIFGNLEFTFNISFIIPIIFYLSGFGIQFILIMIDYQQCNSVHLILDIKDVKKITLRIFYFINFWLVSSFLYSILQNFTKEKNKKKSIYRLFTSFIIMLTSSFLLIMSLINISIFILKFQKYIIEWLIIYKLWFLIILSLVINILKYKRKEKVFPTINSVNHKKDKIDLFGNNIIYIN